VSNPETFAKVAQGIGEGMETFGAFVWPWTEKMAAITDDREGMQAVASVMAQALLSPVNGDINPAFQRLLVDALRARIPALQHAPDRPFTQGA
jgi:hypothetical protein